MTETLWWIQINRWVKLGGSSSADKPASPCEDTNCFCALQLNIMKIQGVMCVQLLARARSPPPWHMGTCTQAFAWWTFIRMQSRRIMWFKQSSSWQTCPPCWIKDKSKHLETADYVDLAKPVSVWFSVRVLHTCTGLYSRCEGRRITAKSIIHHYNITVCVRTTDSDSTHTVSRFLGASRFTFRG